ncbi:plant basic secretory protein [Artomyces pyxidatus]|uniref:Plant basic secretory protein n=1 Tax=Artomyces pyxidatus TaxID=48021 RepID=A0ACB8THY4_9AGAM|nr:plant basic secretory protein [Artomyces pyxidatus]
MPPPPIPPRPDWQIPTLKLRIDDLSHPGAKLFLDSVDSTQVLHDAVVAVLQWLYVTTEKAPKNVESILLVLRPMDGVAYTTGSDTEKEIHFACQHIVNTAARAADEIRGVLTHEVVHCYQYNANGTAPGGLIEGIADWVRLRAGFVPPHWRPGGDRWDAGYQTTGYFLHWLEGRYGEGTVQDLNEALKDTVYDEEIFKVATGRKVGKLWKLYLEHLESTPEFGLEVAQDR